MAAKLPTFDRLMNPVRRNNSGRGPRTPGTAARIGRGGSWAAPLLGRSAPESGVRTRGSRQRTYESRVPRLPGTVLRRSVSGDPCVVLVMEPAEDRSRNNVLGRDSSHGRQLARAIRWLHAKTAMGSAMIVTSIFLQDARGVNLVEDNHMVEAIPAQSSVQTFADGVGLRGSWWRDQAKGPTASHAPTEIVAVDGITVADQESRIHVVPIGDGFDKALPRKLRAWRWCDSDVDDLSSGQVNDDEAVQDLEAQGDYCKKIARPGLMEMVANKRGPALATVARQVRWSVLGDGPRRDVVSKLSKFRGDAVLTPKRVLLPKPAYQGAQVGIGRRSANGPLGLRPPDQTPKGTMPADNSLGPYDGDRIKRRAEEAGTESKQDAISRSEAGLGHRTLQYDDLLAENEVFGEEGGTGLDDRTQRAEHGLEDLNKHRGEMPTTRRSLDESWGNCGEFERSDRVFAANNGDGRTGDEQSVDDGTEGDA